MTTKKKVLIIIIVALAFLFILFLVRGPEDDWICVDGEWIKHGLPSRPMPSEPCNQ